jgi:threonyl-tRNA synthetase
VTTGCSASSWTSSAVDQRVGAGLILWHPKGALVRMEIENYERELILRHGYELVYTPHIMSEKLFEISGTSRTSRRTCSARWRSRAARIRPKPMNCPGHIASTRRSSAPTATCRSATPSSARSTATSGAVCCTACCACAASRRTTPTSSARPSRSPREIERLLDLVDEMLTTFGYPYTHRAGDPAREGIGRSRRSGRWPRRTLADVLTARPGVRDR